MSQGLKYASFILILCVLPFIVGGIAAGQAGDQLEVTITLSPGDTVLQGEILTIYVDIKNLTVERIGSEYQKPIQITLRYEGVDEDTELSRGKIADIKDEEALPPGFDYIKPGETKRFKTTFDTIRAGFPLPAGAYEISADVLVVWTITGEVVAHSFTTSGLQVKKSEIKADLVMDQLKLKFKTTDMPVQEVIDDNVRFSIEPLARNKGTSSADKRCKLEILRRSKGQPNFEPLQGWEVPEMARGDEFKGLSFETYEWSPGVYVLQARVDTEGEIAELVEENNVLSKTLFIVNHDQMSWTYPCIPITIMRGDEREDLECDLEEEKPGPIAAGPLVVQEGNDKLIYFGSDDGHLYVVRSSGSFVDKYPRDKRIGALKAAPVVLQGTIYLGSDDGHIYALNSAREKKWQYPKEGEAPLGPIRAAPAVVIAGEGESERRFIYFGSDDGNLYALQEQGEEVQPHWSAPFRTGAFIRTTPAVVNLSEGEIEKRIIYFGSGDGNFYAIWDREGEPWPHWTYPTGSFVKSSPRVFNKTIYFGSSDGHLYALFLDGTKKWQYPPEGEEPIGSVESTPLVAVEGERIVIYLGSNDGSLYKLEEDEEGLVSWEWELSEYEGRPLGPVRSSPVRREVREDEWMIYFGSDDGTLYAVYDDGREEWTFSTRGAITGSPAIEKNILYLTSWEGTLYALRSEEAD